MPRYIDADALLEKFDEYEPINWTGTEWENQMQSDYRFYRGLVESAPTADVAEVKHGEWLCEPLDKHFKVEVTCSACGWFAVDNYDAYVDPRDFEYCPNCGAKMDGGKTE